MAGHSHWKNIKRKKEAADKKKAQAFSKAAKMIISAIKQGGANPETNYALRVAIEYAKSVRMPKENVERLLKKYSEGGGSQNFTTVIYEVFGPRRVPILVKVLTDNTNRTLTELRTTLRKLGGQLADKGSVIWQFQETGRIVVSVEESYAEEKGLEIMDIIEVDDLEVKKDKIVIFVNRDKLSESTQKLMDSGFTVTESGVFYKYTGVPMEINRNELDEFITQLTESCEDIEEVWTVF